MKKYGAHRVLLLTMKEFYVDRKLYSAIQQLYAKATRSAQSFYRYYGRMVSLISWSPPRMPLLSPTLFDIFLGKVLMTLAAWQTVSKNLIAF